MFPDQSIQSVIFHLPVLTDDNATFMQDPVKELNNYLLKSIV